MASRLELHEKLCGILGNRHVYFQPPPNVKLVYPCFVYSRNAGDEIHADNKRYRFERRYQLTYISTEADDLLPEKIGEFFSKIRYGSDFVSENLYHSNFDIYF